MLADKDVHPRFHIGESLIPMNVPQLAKLGVGDEIERIGIRKYAAEFTSMYHDKTVAFEFAEAFDKSNPYAYQVRRSDFDHMLLGNARRHGVPVLEGCRVREVDLRHDKRSIVRAKSNEGVEHEWRPRFVVDATGRDTLLATKLGIKNKNKKHASSALYGHFAGAKRHVGRDEGNISIYWFDHGWIWFIPLLDGTTSVGAVCWPYYLRSRKVDPTTFFIETLKSCPPVWSRLADATLTGPATATGNYSYMAAVTGDTNYILAGDAFAFVDPVFSAGVYLAMNSGFAGADAVLRNPARAPQALARYDHTLRHGIKSFTWFVYRMTSPSLRDMFMGPRNVLRIQEALMSLLAGDIFRNRGIVRRLAVFKALYYSFNLFYPRRTYAAWKRRKYIVRSADAGTQTQPASTT